GLNNKDSAGWDMLASFADDPTGGPLPDRNGALCDLPDIPANRHTGRQDRLCAGGLPSSDRQRPAVATHNRHEFEFKRRDAGCPSVPIEYPAPGSQFVRKGPQMFTARLATAVTAPLLIAGAVLASSAAPTQAKSACEDADVAVMSSPVAPWKGAPLRVVFAAEHPIQGELSLVAPDGSVAAKSRQRYGGPPYFWFVDVQSPAAGTWRATLAGSDCTRAIAVRGDQRARRQALSGLFAIHGIVRQKICFLHGWRSFSMHRSMRRHRGPPCTRCCAIDRETSCSIIWVSVKTR